MTACLDGFTPWPDDMAALYRAKGYWAGESLGAMLRARATQYPARVALVCGERRWTYADLDRRSDSLAAGLARLGILARDRVVVQTAIDAFGQHMRGPNQLDRLHDIKVTADMLLEPLRGPITEQGVRWNLHVGVRYLEAWLDGSGAEPIHNLMEDLATSEISSRPPSGWSTGSTAMARPY